MTASFIYVSADGNDMVQGLTRIREGGTQASFLSVSSSTAGVSLPVAARR